ncbi:unnamed protein product (macronuclear) [Paramecium tetraurelia]|uniref:Uncharacterized protein n=1 Tax=Paramecium tetraurelia TaxID=5888 RepID=A0BAK0_PARTE|nr:uncharacterized protein GSPATT00000002001 [Paramecium tetraurelia]CAK55567.1 unnamed protein product [Paramecium tetraurelia]
MEHSEEVPSGPVSQMDERGKAQMGCIEIQRGQEMRRGKKVKFKEK